jgi:glyoxylase-like metal-dependent hydrolase (beta-lactamase superfamily II)
MPDRNSGITRRGAILAAAGTTAAMALPHIAALQAQAAAAMMGLQRPHLYRFKLGAFEITTFLDGGLQRQGPYPIFGSDQPEEKVHALLKDNFLPPTKFENPYVPTLLNTGKELILFDTGNGPLRRDKGAGMLAALMVEAGYKLDQVDIVVITHGHPDHFGGMMEGDGPSFPNARYVFGAVEFDHWNKGENIPDRRVKTRELFMKIAVPFSEKATFLKGGDDVVTGIRAIEAFGHSPGHMAFHVESEGQQLMIWADTCNHYVVYGSCAEGLGRWALQGVTAGQASQCSSFARLIRRATLSSPETTGIRFHRSFRGKELRQFSVRI